MELLIIFGLLLSSYSVVASKRLSSLIANFRLQSLLLCVLMLVEAYKGQFIELYVVALLLFFLKVLGIPYFLTKIISEIKTGEDLGFFINPQLSLVFSLVFTGFGWLFSDLLFPGLGIQFKLYAAVSFLILMQGFFIMVFRLKALAQIVGLLIMENGIFLLGVTVLGGMPFLVEMAVFLDVMVSVIILGLFVYRINRLFTSIDVSRMSVLRG